MGHCSVVLSDVNTEPLGITLPFLRPGLESMGFSWTKNSVIQRFFRTISTDSFHKI